MVIHKSKSMFVKEVDRMNAWAKNWKCTQCNRHDWQPEKINSSSFSRRDFQKRMLTVLLLTAMLKMYVRRVSIWMGFGDQMNNEGENFCCYHHVYTLFRGRRMLRVLKYLLSTNEIRLKITKEFFFSGLQL